MCSIFLGAFFFSVCGEINDTLFFKDIELKLRQDYRTCTGDTTAVPLKKVIVWRQSVDSIIKTKDYSQIEKAFYNDPDHRTSKHTACEIVAWYQQKMHDRRIADSLQKDILARQKTEHTDSLYTAKELQLTRKSSCDLLDIPFGISQKSVTKMLRDKGIDDYSGDSVTLHYKNENDPIFNIIALYFDKNGLFYKYEIESITGPIDSLDTSIRPFAARLAFWIQDKTGFAPNQNNYVGLTDIKQGNLSITQVWKLDLNEIYIGLAVYNQRYYAKAIVLKTPVKQK